MKIIMNNVRKNLLAHLLALAAVVVPFVPHEVESQTVQMVMTPAVQVQYINGEMRFCENEYIRGIVCGFDQKLAGVGKKRFAARDWWTMETYVKARTGLKDVHIQGVTPSPDGTGLVIYYVAY